MRSLLFTVVLAATAAQAADETHWSQDEKGCKVFNPAPAAGETISWSGACADGYAQGPGTLQFRLDDKRGSRTEANFEHGKAAGKGTLNFANGAKYEGDFAEGLREGHGVMTYANGDRYEGDWKAGRRTGRGTVTFTKGGRYEGEWLNDHYEGKGLLVYDRGDTIEGQFVGGRIEGHGEAHYIGGGTYVGEWKNGLQSGHGKAVWSNSSEYDGEWKNGRPADLFGMVYRGYSLTEDATGSYMPRKVITGLNVPPDKRYEELSPEDVLRLKESYKVLGPGDEPPFPLYGLRPALDAINRLRRKHHPTGELRLLAEVDTDGKATNVWVLDAPDPDFAHLAAEVLLLTQFKPARRSGTAVASQFPFHIYFP